MVKSSYQVLDIARKKKISEHILSLICESASYVLHAIAQVDKAASKDDDKVYTQWNSRSEIFQKMRSAFHDWITHEDIMGGSLFGGTIPHSTRRKYRGKEELKVCSVLSHAQWLIFEQTCNLKWLLFIVLECTVVH